MKCLIHTYIREYDSTTHHFYAWAHHELGMMCPICMSKFQYVTSAWLALPNDHCLVSILFPDVSVTIYCIPTSNFMIIFLNVLHICVCACVLYTNAMYKLLKFIDTIY